MNKLPWYVSQSVNFSNNIHYNAASLESIIKGTGLYSYTVYVDIFMSPIVKGKGIRMLN